MDNRGRIQIIDAFRGFAIISVICYHYLIRWAAPSNSQDLTNYHFTYSQILDVGKYGVELFFVISGLVISMTVMRVRSALEFAVHRFARLYPAFLVALIMTYIVTQFGPAEFKTSPWDLICNFSMTPSLLHARAVDGVYWSLTIEIEFYFIVAFAFVLLKNRFWMAVLCVALLSGIATLIGHGANLLFAQYWPYFMFGMGASFGLMQRQIVPAICLGSTGLLLFVLNPLANTAANVYILVTFAALFGLLALKRSTPFDVLAWVGRISYSLYLIHQFIGVTIIHTLTSMGSPDFLAIFVALATVTALATAMYLFVELPAQRAIRALFDNLNPFRSPVAKSLEI